MLARGFQRVFDAMPWQGDPSFAAVMAGARRRDGRPPHSGRSEPVVVPSEERRRPELCHRARSGSTRLELGETAALLAALWVIARMSERGRLSLGRARWLLVVVAFLDLWALGRHRLLDVGPLKPLVEQSPVLAALAREPRGTRIAGDRFKNMPMLIGQAPISAYRTLDLPAVPELTSLTHGPMGAPVIAPLVRRALRATGTGVRVFDPIENRTDRVLARDGRASRNDRGSRPGQLALRRIVGGRPGAMGSNLLDLARSESGRPRLAGSRST